MTINQFMTTDHRACDEEFAKLENLIDENNFTNADNLFEDFKNHMFKHFDMEEKIMFPQFNESSHEGCNPTGVMIMEHDQMRELINRMETALKSKDKEQFLGLSENLLFVMQQHNMKEEQIMYNLVDQTLNSDEIIKQMQEI